MIFWMINYIWKQFYSHCYLTGIEIVNNEYNPKQIFDKIQIKVVYNKLFVGFLTGA